MAFAGIDPSQLPAFDLSPKQDDRPKPGALKAGLAAGFHELVGLGGSAIEGVGKLVGSQAVTNYGLGVANNQNTIAQRVGRPDLEVAPWHEGGASIAPWLAYQAAKMVPTLAGYAGATALAPEAAIPAGLVRAGATLPEFLGGAALKEGASFATRRAALETGAGLGKFLVGGGAFGGATGFGQAVQSASQKPGGLTVGDAAQAAAESPIYAAAGLLQPAFLKGALGGVERDAADTAKGKVWEFAKGVISRGLQGAAVGSLQSGILAGLDQTFRPDLTPSQKASGIVDAAVTGAAVGGAFGGATGIRALKRADPRNVTEGDLASGIDEALQAPRLGLPAPNMYTDSAGRTAPSSTGDEILRATPRNPGEPAPINPFEAPPALFGPESVSDRAAVPGSTITVGRRGEGGRFTSEATGVEQPPVVPEDTSRSFRNMTSPELISAANALANRGESRGVLSPDEKLRAQSMMEEIQLRRRNGTLTTDDVSTSPEAVEQLANQRGTGEQNSATPASTSDYVGKITEGLKLPTSLRERLSQARSEDDVHDIVHDYTIVQGKTGKNADTLGQRTGLLDDEGKPTQMATEIAAKKTPEGDEAPDYSFVSSWKQDVKKVGQKDETIRGMNPVNQADAQLQLYRALGKEGEVSDAVETMAQKQGVLDADKRLTPLAMQLAEKDPIPREDATAEARGQGLKGSSISMFRRGVMAYTDEGPTLTKFGNPDGAAAYQSGFLWAEKTNSVPRGTLKKYEPSAFTKEVTPEEQALGQPAEIRKGSIPAEVEQAKLVNQAIDNANLSPTKSETEVATLKNMVRDNNIEGAMDYLHRINTGEAAKEASAQRQDEIRYYQTGHGALARAAPRTDLKSPERPIPGQPRMEERGRAAPLAPSKSTSRAEAEKAIRHYELSRTIEAAHAEGTIDSRERISLVNELHKGNYGEVMKRLPYVEFDPRRSPVVTSRIADRKVTIADLADALRQMSQEAEVPELQVDKNGVLKNEQVKLARRDFLAGIAATAAAGAHAPARAALTFKPASEALTKLISNNGADENYARPILEHLRSNASDPSYRMIAAKLLRGDQKSWDNVKIMRVPDSDEVRGVTILNDDGSSTVQIAGKDGMNEQTILHELIHAYVQQRWGGLSSYLPENKRLVKDTVERHDAQIGQFRDLWRKLGLALEKSNPGIADREVWAQAISGDSDEMLSWALTNPDAQTYLKSIDIDGNRIRTDKPASQKTFWDHVVDFFRDLFGLNGKQTTALDHVMSAGYAVLDSGADVRTGDFNVKLAAEMRRERMSNDQSRRLQTPPVVNQQIKDTIQKINDAVDKKIGGEGIAGILRRGQLYATSMHHITEHFGSYFEPKKGSMWKHNGLKQHEEAQDYRDAVQQRHAQLVDDVMDRVYALEGGDKAARESFNDISVLATASEYGINYTRDWDGQIKEVQANPVLKDKVEKYNKIYRSLLTKGHAAIVDDMRKFNEVLRLAETSMSLHDSVSFDKVAQGRIPEFANSPMDQYMDEHARAGYDLAGSHDFWNRKLDEQVRGLKEFAKAYETTPIDTKLPSSIRKANAAGMKSLGDHVDTIGAIRSRLDNVPYFHLGRDGSYFVDMKLKLGKDGKVDPAALAEAAERLTEFGRVISPEVHPDNDQGHIYIRVNDTVAQRNLMDAAYLLQKDEIVRPDRVDADTGQKVSAVQSGKITDTRIRNGLASQWAQRLIAELKANPHIDPEDHQTLANTIMAQTIDLMPENTLAKMLTHREGVPGYDPDMIKSYNARAKVGIDALSGMAAARKFTDSYSNMRLATRDAQGSSPAQVKIAQRNGMTEIMDEISRHDNERANSPRGGRALDQLQGFSGAFFLSANLAYPAVNLLQVPMIALPRLGSKFGYLKSARAMASATKEAAGIMRAIAATGLKVSKSRAADAVVTMEALKAQGVSPHKAEFLMQVANRGGLDIGGAARNLARNAQGIRGNKIDQTLRIASALGYYSETMSRLVVALASHKLHTDAKIPPERMVPDTVNILKNSMWDYSSPNTARMLGRNGFLGQFTPLATQFFKYTAMLNETLYREVHKALGGDAEAARFLAGHLAMTTVFAGALGLPFASVFAATYDRLKDMFAPDGQPSDVMASFRNGVADMFGKDAAEVISRGTPRLAGVDLSTRVGEQDILPFSKFIADRRDLQDSLKDLQSRAWGAPSSMMLNLATGAQRVAQGDLVGGFRQALPLGLSSMVKAYQMTSGGYTDTHGNVLPMEPGALATLAQAVGFNPAQNAEYGEARGDQKNRQYLLARQAANMRGKIVDAVVGGDHDRARELITEAIAFDRENPSYGVLRGVEGSIKRRGQQQAVSQQTRTPLGISPKDTYAPQLTRYANVEFRAQ
jgi:hypothetical protein